MKSYKYLVLLCIITFVLAISSFIVVRYVNFKKSSLLNENYKLQTIALNEKLNNEISRKRESTTDIAMSLASSSDLAQKILDRNIPTKYYAKLVEKLKKSKLYKNAWIQIIDKNGTSLYRSWSKKRNDNLLESRKDIAKLLSSKKSSFSISIGKFDLSFKTIMPIYKDNSFLGFIEIISHFNSISKNLQKEGIFSVVVVKKENEKQLLYPFSQLFIGKYYIANANAPLKFRNYLKKYGIKNYFNNLYKIENDYLIVSHPIKNINSNIIAYYIMFKKLNNTQNKNLNLFIFKLFLILLIIFLSLILIGIIIFFIINEKQKKHYRSIIDSSTNIMITNNSLTITAANKAFFKVFYKYTTIKEFLAEHECICDFFIEDNNYLQKHMNGKIWLEYLIQNQNNEHKVKINYIDTNYYFLISASLINSSSKEYCIVLTDITRQEKYKKELELLTITDPLTKIKNRRFYETKIKEEINRAKRYSIPLSIIMFDIDHFKKINDKYGHDVGDEILVSYSKLIYSLIREEDSFSRIGGEEFIIMLPHLKLSNATKLAEKLRKTVEEKKDITPITISFGVVQYIQGETKEQLYKRLDDALYKAKEKGRNRVVVSK